MKWGKKMKILALTCCCVDVFPDTGGIIPGGNALNLAVGCKTVSKAEVYLMGCIGKDLYGEKIKEAIDAHDIKREKLYEIEGESASNRIFLTSEGERYFKTDSWNGGVYETFILSSEDKSYIHTMDAVATTYYDPNFLTLLEERRKGQFMMAVDFHDEALQLAWEEYLPNIDLFFISGKEEQFEQFKRWSMKYETLFVATLGAKGSIAFKNGECYITEAVPVKEVVDTTGCGDAYQGAFIASYIVKKDIPKAMEAGSIAAAKTLSHMGGV